MRATSHARMSSRPKCTQSRQSGLRAIAISLYRYHDSAQTAQPASGGWDSVMTNLAACMCLYPWPLLSITPCRAPTNYGLYEPSVLLHSGVTHAVVREPPVRVYTSGVVKTSVSSPFEAIWWSFCVFFGCQQGSGGRRRSERYQILVFCSVLRDSAPSRRIDARPK